MSILRFQSTFPRGERPRKDTVRFILDNFNPRSRVGNDNCRTKRRRVCARFQSTFPRGERLLLRRRCLKNSVFQSTFPRGERRQGNHRRFYNKKRFQSTFPRGERPELRWKKAVLRLFQSTFPRGERLADPIATPAVGSISIHVPAWGTTACIRYAHTL